MALGITNLIANFDLLMDSVDTKIKGEYSSQRIVGSDYATVYLGALQSTLQTALGYETQGLTAAAEVALLTQKALTEEAQIKDVLSDGTIVYVPTVDKPADPTYAAASGGGVMGKQQVLYNKQTDGFDRDAEQKLIKVMNDLYSIDMSVNPLAPVLPNENKIPGIDNVLKAAKVSIGITPET